MEIKRVKLVNGGKGGLEIEGSENVLKDSVTIVDGVKRTRGLPTDYHFNKIVSRLKPYYLMLTGHFRTEWEDMVVDGEVDRKKVEKKGYSGLVSLLDNTTIKILDTKAGLQIGGSIVTLGDKSVWITTPRLHEDDEFPFYDKIHEIFGEIWVEVKNYFTRKELFAKEEARQLLLDMMQDMPKKDEEEITRVKEQEQEMCEEELIAKLQAKGFLVIWSDEGMLGIEGSKEVKEEIIPAVDEF